MKLFQREADLDGAEHFVLNPSGYGTLVALPFDDGLSRAPAQLLGELFAGEITGVSKFSELLAGHGRCVEQSCFFYPLSNFFI